MSNPLIHRGIHITRAEVPGASYEWTHDETNAHGMAPDIETAIAQIDLHLGSPVPTSAAPMPVTSTTPTVADLEAELTRALNQIESLEAECDRRHAELQDALPGAEMPRAWLDVMGERCRQIAVKGRAPEHDDAHERGEIIWETWGAQSRLCRAIEARRTGDISEYRRLLIEAGAMTLAEIERVDRLQERVLSEAQA